LIDAARRLPAELRAVLRKTLALDRDDRYDSAAALADDLDRYRRHRPLKAMPATRWYVARTFLARHRLGLAAAAIVALALIAGIALAMAGLAEARRAAAAARIEAEKADQIAGFVRGMLAGIDPNTAKTMDLRLMRLVLDQAAARADRELARQPAVRASIERTIADAYSSLGDFDRAGRHYDAAFDAGRAGAVDAVEQARNAMRRAENVDNRGDAQEALRQGNAAFALVEHLPADDRDRLYVEGHLAGLECDAGRLETSRTRYRRVLAAQRRLFGDADDDTLNSIEGLAITDSYMARYDDARPLYEELVATYRSRFGDDNTLTLGATNGLAVLDLEQKHFAEAEKLLAPAVATAERLLGPDHPLTVQLLSNYGGAIRQQDRNAEARPYYERAFAATRRLYGEEGIRTVSAESNLALLLRDLGDLDAAEKHARSAVEHADRSMAGNAYRGIIHREHATILLRMHRFGEAERELDAAWSVLSEAPGYGPDHPRSQDVVDTYIDLYTVWGKPERAAAWRARKVAATAAS
jgi:non-specific serine/threonine protein kinase/serine/threonine-protein kinase